VVDAPGMSTNVIELLNEEATPSWTTLTWLMAPPYHCSHRQSHPAGQKQYYSRRRKQ